MSAWYMDMWVNAPWPVMSPMAHTPGRDPQVVIHRDGVRALVHAHHAHADPGQVSPPPGRDEQRVPGHLGAVGQGQGEAVPS